DAIPWTRALIAKRMWLRVGLASMVGTYCGIWLAQTALLKARSTGVATTLLATSPVFALPIAHLAGNERMTARAVIGVLIAIGGRKLSAEPFTMQALACQVTSALWPTQSGCVTTVEGQRRSVLNSKTWVRAASQSSSGPAGPLKSS